MADRLGIGRALHRLLPGAVQVVHRLGGVAAATVMMRQGVVVLRQTLGKEPLDGLRGTFMQAPPPLQQHSIVGDFLRQGVLEGVFQLREQARLIEELRRLQVRQAPLHGRPGDSAMACRSAAGHLRADDCSRLEELFLLRGQAVDTRRQHRLHGGGHLNARERLGQTIGPALAHQHLGFHQRPHTLFQKEGIALGAGDQERREGRQAGVVSQQGLEQRLALAGGSGSSRSWV